MSQTVPTTKPTDPLVGMVVYNASAGELQIFNGQAWITIHQSNVIYCVVCKKAVHMIENNLIPDHPFCGDNLEYLEWKLGQREQDSRRV